MIYLNKKRINKIEKYLLLNTLNNITTEFII